ncbi:MAG: LysR family transcriptional regulator [Halobacteriota archaeon]|nr:LysR family transcriptional regulator [Halobacteriota archaeon]
MKIIPQISLLIGDKRLSIRQLEALSEISKTRSQTQAARILGISTPVLHRYIKRGEGELGFSLIKTTPTGSILTPEGIEIVNAYKRYLKATLPPNRDISIGCSVITQYLLLESLSSLEEDGGIFNVYIGDDETNRRLLELGELDLVIFDDPLHVYDYEGDLLYKEIAFDTLYHVYRGKSYIKYRYGAQRIGFKHLISEGIDYRIEYNTSSVSPLLSGKLSYFINQSIVSRLDLSIKSDTSPRTFKHAIIAMILRESDELFKLVSEMKRHAEKFGFIT